MKTKKITCIQNVYIIFTLSYLKRPTGHLVYDFSSMLEAISLYSLPPQTDKEVGNVQLYSARCIQMGQINAGIQNQQEYSLSDGVTFNSLTKCDQLTAGRVTYRN